MCEYGVSGSVGSCFSYWPTTLSNSTVSVDGGIGGIGMAKHEKVGVGRYGMEREGQRKGLELGEGVTDPEGTKKKKFGLWR